MDAFQQAVCDGGHVSKPYHTRLANFPGTLRFGGHRQGGSIRLENCPVICYKHIVNSGSLRCLSLPWWANAIPLGSWEAMSTLIHAAVGNTPCLGMERSKASAQRITDSGEEGEAEHARIFGGGEAAPPPPLLLPACISPKALCL